MYILSDRMSQIRFDSPYLLDRMFSIRSAVEYFDIRSAFLRMLDFRHSISRSSNVGFSIYEARPISDSFERHDPRNDRNIFFIVLTTELSSRFVSLKRTSRQIDRSDRATEKLVFKIKNIFIAKNNVKNVEKPYFKYSNNFMF